MVIICCSSIINFIRCFDIYVGSIFILQDQMILKSNISKLNITFRICYCDDCFWKYSGFSPSILCFLMEITGTDVRYSENILTNRINVHFCSKKGRWTLIWSYTSCVSLSAIVSLLINFSFPLGTQEIVIHSRYGVKNCP